MQSTRTILLLTLLAPTVLAAEGNSASARDPQRLAMACHADTGYCSLKDSGPIVATRDGQVIEGLRIEATDQPAISVHALRNVVIRNVEIRHDGAHGISCERSPGLVIENVSITRSRAANRSKEQNNINAYRCDKLSIRNARLTGGSAGVYALRSKLVHLSNIEGHNFVGPDPRGQLVQFDKSPYCLLEDFSAYNAPIVSHTEDNVSIYFSDYCILRRGLLVGNNSPSGVGVMFEESRHGLVEDVDTVAQGNGSFSAYPGHDVTFRRTRARDNICQDQGRGKPLSDSLIWTGSEDSGGLRIVASTYFIPCNPQNVIWSMNRFDLIEINEDDFSPRPAIVNRFCWELANEVRPES
jgi:hypothetical protein